MPMMMQKISMVLWRRARKMLKDIHYKKTITWTKKCKKGRQELKYSYIL
jgi:hypothetical protein